MTGMITVRVKLVHLAAVTGWAASASLLGDGIWQWGLWIALAAASLSTIAGVHRVLAPALDAFRFGAAAARISDNDVVPLRSDFEPTRR